MAVVPTTTDQEREELESVLHSGIFAKARQQAKLLEYICTEYLSGRADRIKEYSLATEALGKDADFDQNRDAIVRVEFHRLRKKLKEYYEGEGASHALRIMIDHGHYVPRFVPRDKAPSLPNASPSEAVDPAQPYPADKLEPSAVPSGRRGTATLLAALVLLAVVAFAVLLERTGRLPSLLKPSPANRARPASPASAAGSLESVRILCGYTKDKYIDRAGNTWFHDEYFSGGAAFAQQPEFIARAPDAGLYQTFRSGVFSYDIPLRPGNYEVHLYFVETHYGPGTLSGGGETNRLFNVSLNGKPLLQIFDIIKDASGNNIADVRVFKDRSPGSDGYLHLKFDSLIDSPILNAIEIEPAPPGKINPVRIVAQNNSYTDHSGNIWSPDRYFSGGQLATHTSHSPVRRTNDPGLFAGERFGNFSYAIPVAPGKYRVTLRFAETYWGVDSRTPSLPDQNGSLAGGIGSRIFDVQCNGSALLRNFDVFKEAGGPLVALEKTFHNLEPNAEGKLLLSFVPVKDYSSVTAVEVVNEPD